MILIKHRPTLSFPFTHPNSYVFIQNTNLFTKVELLIINMEVIKLNQYSDYIMQFQATGEIISDKSKNL